MPYDLTRHLRGELIRAYDFNSLLEITWTFHNLLVLAQRQHLRITNYLKDRNQFVDLCGLMAELNKVAPVK